MAKMMAVYGRIQRESEVVHLVAHRVTDLSDLLASIEAAIPQLRETPTGHLERRLRDAQAQALVDNLEIHTSPGPLFWAFDPKFACDLLQRTGRQNLIPLGFIENAAGALVLIDEQRRSPMFRTVCWNRWGCR